VTMSKTTNTRFWAVADNHSNGCRLSI
jgi:hypothetical protein